MPSGLERRQWLIPAGPDAAPRTLNGTVRPLRHGFRGVEIMRNRVRVEIGSHRRRFPTVALHPTREMSDVGKQVTLVVVAGSMDQHEVVTKVEGVTTPGDEMVDFPAAMERRAAVETRIGLLLPEQGCVVGQGNTLRTEQELVEIDRLAEQGSIAAKAADPAYPRPLHEVLDVAVKDAKAEGNPRPQRDGAAGLPTFA